MKITNENSDTRLTWGGTDVQPGQTIDTEELGLSDAEIQWLLRRGFGKAGGPKSVPDPEPPEDDDDEPAKFHRPRKKSPLRRKR